MFSALLHFKGASDSSSVTIALEADYRVRMFYIVLLTSLAMLQQQLACDEGPCWGLPSRYTSLAMLQQQLAFDKGPCWGLSRPSLQGTTLLA